MAPGLFNSTKRMGLDKYPIHGQVAVLGQPEVREHGAAVLREVENAVRSRVAERSSPAQQGRSVKALASIMPPQAFHSIGKIAFGEVYMRWLR